MSTISSFTILNSKLSHSSLPATPSTSSECAFLYPSLSQKLPTCPHILSLSRRKSLPPVCCNSPEAEELSSPEGEDEWLQKLPEKKKPLCSHSLPCIEAWLSSLGFYQSQDDRAVWLIQKLDWHAHLSLDITDLYVFEEWVCRYLKSGPGNLEKDVERRFSYALSREDIENAVLGGP